MLSLSRHPFYSIDDNLKYRLTYEGGERFIESYLQRNERESSEEFNKRKSMTYCPAFAEEGIDEIKNNIIQRMTEIRRTSASQSYTDACAGLKGGVDLYGSTMNRFVGQCILAELMVMGRVGVYVDMPRFAPEATLASFLNEPRPYIYAYCADNIMSWAYNSDSVLTAVLLREQYIQANEYGLYTDAKERFRYLRLTANGVEMTLFRVEVNPNGDKVETIDQKFLLQLTQIPFVMGDIQKSLLTNVANYQIALLNIASSDVSYVLNANFPFYIEPYDPKVQNTFAKKKGFDSEGNETESGEAEVVTGNMKGRKYPLDARQSPAFIHPSPEPLQASMAKQEQIKNDIRRLLNLAVSQVSDRTSAESKKMDQSGLESGMSALGMVVSNMELRIALIWLEYEKNPAEASVAYPKTYKVKSDGERLTEVKQLHDIRGIAPGRRFAKELAKEAAMVMFQDKITQDSLDLMLEEIDTAEYITSDAKEIALDIENGLVTLATASNARGYDGKKETPLAKAEHTERLKQIAIAQTVGVGGGVNELPTNQG